MEVEQMIGSIDEVGRATPPYALVALIPPRRVLFLLGGAVSSSML
jgi:hypothetical protein